MDLIVITINKTSLRKLVKKYLQEIDLGDFLSIYSQGSSMFYNNISLRRIDSPFDNNNSLMTTGKTIFSLNTSDLETDKIIDHIYNIFEKDRSNTGIAFSIPLSQLITKPS